MSNKYWEFFRGIDPRKGRLLRNWNNAEARRVDYLAQAGLVQWMSEGTTLWNTGIRVVLTPKGQTIRRRLHKTG